MKKQNYLAPALGLGLALALTLLCSGCGSSEGCTAGVGKKV